MLFIFFVAIMNVAFGFALAMYLGGHYHSIRKFGMLIPLPYKAVLVAENVVAESRMGESVAAESGVAESTMGKGTVGESTVGESVTAESVAAERVSAVVSSEPEPAAAPSTD